MSAQPILAVFCYDISRDRIRAKICDLLETEAVRVQESVFEGWMSEAKARRLCKRLATMIDEEDSMRLYLIDRSAALKTIAHGATPSVEADDFHLF